MRPFDKVVICSQRDKMQCHRHCHLDQHYHYRHHINIYSNNKRLVPQGYVHTVADIIIKTDHSSRKMSVIFFKYEKSLILYW